MRGGPALSSGRYSGTRLKMNRVAWKAEGHEISPGKKAQKKILPTITKMIQEFLLETNPELRKEET